MGKAVPVERGRVGPSRKVLRKGRRRSSLVQFVLSLPLPPFPTDRSDFTASSSSSSSSAPNPKLSFRRPIYGSIRAKEHPSPSSQHTWGKESFLFSVCSAFGKLVCAHLWSPKRCPQKRKVFLPPSLQNSPFTGRGGEDEDEEGGYFSSPSSFWRIGFFPFDDFFGLSSSWHMG